MPRLLGRLLAEAGRPAPVPFVYRPIIQRRNVMPWPSIASRANSYMRTADDRLLLVYDDVILAHEFDDRSTLAAAIDIVQASDVRQIRIGNGILKIILVFLAFLIIPSLITSFHL